MDLEQVSWGIDMPDRAFRVVIFSMAPPQSIACLVSRILREIPEAMICGVLYETRPAKSLGQRIALWLRGLRDPTYFPYVAERIWSGVLQALRHIGTLLLRLYHACPTSPNGRKQFDLKDLARLLEKEQGSVLVTANMHAAESLQFVCSLRADLGLVYGTRILKPELFNIPVQGSINIHKRKVPDYRGGGPVGLWELLAGESEIGVTVHRVDVKLDAGAVINSATIPIDPYDNLNSLGLKADVVGNDLIVRSVADFARGAVREKPQTEGGQMFRNPKSQQLRAYRKQIAARRQAYKAVRGRSLLKLLVRAILFAPGVIARNWSRRLRGRFPIVILYHHLVSDRPHPLGISTDAFLKQAEFLLTHYKIASLREAIEMLKSGTVKAPTIVLTFDDGYKDNFVNLRSVVEKTAIPVTLFVCSGHVATGSEFQHDVRKNLTGFSPLSWEQVVSLSRNGFELGGHTRFHFDCGSSDREALTNEIVGCRTGFEKYLGRPVDFFSFPWGLPENMSPLAVDLARAAYGHIFSAYGGVNFPSRFGTFWHLKRCPHSSDSLELELQLQSILDFKTPRPKQLQE
jgi:peptidoglycan/xylan/chitin deacetylase (PgdA/CDA1 family)/folate-dependent phosphoribosylglycinamide formyltransferase PurN